jgi:hypothetical protein
MVSRPGGRAVSVLLERFGPRGVAVRNVHPKAGAR